MIFRPSLFFILAAAFCCSPLPAIGSTFLETSFGSATNALVDTQAGVVQTASGTFYGVAISGGVNGGGAIFSYTPGGGIIPVFNFSSSGANSTTYGYGPFGGMTLAANGNLYGTTTAGGASSLGTIFSYTPGGTVTTQASFTSATGTEVNSALVQGSDGNFYGTSTQGGSKSRGTVFKYVPGGALSAMVSFDASPDKGIASYGALLEATTGTFYGTTYSGGTGGYGEIFSITTSGAFNVLANLTSTTGGICSSTLFKAANGTIYGEGGSGGSGPDGTIFTFSPGTNAVTPFTNFNGTNGMVPTGQLVQTSDGTFYGITGGGGSGGYGTLFKMASDGTLTTLVNFNVANGQDPQGGACLGADGCIYGTVNADSLGNGGVFRYNPSSTETVAYSSVSTVPLLASNITISGSMLAVTLNYAPSPGDVLTVIRNSGSSAINGAFSNLSDGGTITAVYNGTSYTFRASYEGGSGHDLTLTALSTSVPPSITSANNTTFTVGQADSFQVAATGMPAPTFSATGLPSWASLNSTTGLLTGTPPNGAGTPFAIQITASNGVNPAATQNFSLTVSETFAQWESQYGLTGGQTATPQNDGVPNLLKFLYDINPTVPMSATDRAATATIGAITISGTSYLTLTWRQNAALSGVTVTPQSTTDLQNWSAVGPATQVATDATTGDPIMQVQVPFSGQKEFLRLNVTSP